MRAKRHQEDDSSIVLVDYSQLVLYWYLRQSINTESLKTKRLENKRKVSKLYYNLPAVSHTPKLMEFPSTITLALIISNTVGT